MKGAAGWERGWEPGVWFSVSVEQVTYQGSVGVMWVLYGQRVGVAWAFYGLCNGLGSGWPEAGEWQR